MVQWQGEQRCGNQTTMPQAPEAALVASVVDCSASAAQFTKAGLEASERLFWERFAQ
jgi:hypothetical protein